jgi:hypothetical protein
VEGRVGLGLEARDVGLDAARGEQRDLPAAQHDCVGGGQRLPCVVGGLAQVCRARVRVEVGPERLDYLLAREPVIVGQGQELDELGGAPAGPRLGRNLLLVDERPEAPEQFEADPALLRLRSHPPHPTYIRNVSGTPDPRRSPRPMTTHRRREAR